MTLYSPGAVVLVRFPFTLLHTAKKRPAVVISPPPSEPAYLMNHCLRCAAKLTDAHIHAEPGSAFYPTSPEDCCNISVFLLPVQIQVGVVCGWSSGGLTDWLDYDQAETWEALAADPSPML